MGSYGLTKGTRHYIQYQLTDGDTWKDLLFQDSEGQFNGLWCSRSYSRANARIEELMAESDTDRSGYRIVRRTFDETVLVHDPSYGQSAIVESDEDAGDDQDEDAKLEADLEAQVDDVPDAGDDNTGFKLMNNG